MPLENPKLLAYIALLVSKLKSTFLWIAINDENFSFYKVLLLLVYLCMYLCLHVPHVSSCSPRLGIDVGVPGAGVPGSCELTLMGARN